MKLPEVKCRECNKIFKCHNYNCAEANSFVCRCSKCTFRSAGGSKDDFRITKRVGLFCFKGFCELFPSKKDLEKMKVIESL